MRNIKLPQLIGIIILTAFFFPGWVLAKTIITENTVLSTDISGEVEIGANNIILDCNGHRIQGTGAGLVLYGISMFGKSNVVIRNCIIDSFYTGVMIWETASTTIEKNSFTNNGYGVRI